MITGRGYLRFKGIRFPCRFRFTHQAGQSYRHYMEATFFGLPLLKANEHYLNGLSRFELPMGIIENEPKQDSAANLSLWAESMDLPSILLTDPRVRWEPVDETHARLIVPAEDDDLFTVTFDPETGLLLYMEAMRWKDIARPDKVLWRCEALDWERYHGILIPSRMSAKWQDDKEPWLMMTLEEVVYNVDVTSYIRAKGP